MLEAVATRLGKDLDRLGVTVLSVEGKGGLRVARAILCSLGIPTYVLADGDFGASKRRTYKDKSDEEIAAARAQAHGSHKAATEDLLTALPTTSATSHGALPYAFGDPSVVCRDFTLWRDDIEEELAAWTSFDAALAAAGITLMSRNNKNLLAYRNAALAADDADLPDVLKAVVVEIVALSPYATTAG